jgi:prevent-host-death family protein
MSKTISLRQANQAFSRCVRDVEAGEDYVITRRGAPVARLVPVGRQRVLTPEQEAARDRALEQALDTSSRFRSSTKRRRSTAG